MALPMVSGQRYVDQNPTDGRWHVYWGGQDIGSYASRGEAEGAYNARSYQEEQAGAGAQPPAPGTASANPTTSAGTGGSVGSAEAAYALSVWTAAQQAKNNADRLNLLDIPAWQKQAAIADADLKLRQAQEARNNLNDEAKREFDRQTLQISIGQLTGKYNGTDTLAAQAQNANLTGYVNQGGSPTQRVTAAYVQARDAAVAAGRPFDSKATREYLWQAIGGLTPQAAQQLNQIADEYQARTGQNMPADLADQQVRALGGNTGTPTFAREQEQNANALSVLRLQSELRGPGNAFAYGRTIQAVPEAIRAAIGQFANRQGIGGYANQTGGVASVGGLVTDATGTGGYGVSGPGVMVNQRGVMGVSALDQQPDFQAAINGSRGPAAQAQAQQYRAQMQQREQGQPATNLPWPGYPGNVINPAGPGPTTGIAPPFMGGGGPAGPLPPGTQPPPLAPGYTAAGVDPNPNAQYGGPRPVLTTGQPAHLYQMRPSEWQRTDPWNQQLYLAGQEGEGRDKQTELELYRRSLPKFGGPSRGRLAA